MADGSLAEGAFHLYGAAQSFHPLAHALQVEMALRQSRCVTRLDPDAASRSRSREVALNSTSVSRRARVLLTNAAVRLMPSRRSDLAHARAVSRRVRMKPIATRRRAGVYHEAARSTRTLEA